MSGSVRWQIATLICCSYVSVALWAFSKASDPELELFAAANRERNLRRLRSLRWDDSLAAAARKHAAEMLKHNSVSHQFSGEPSLPTRAQQAGVRFTWISENIDQGQEAAIIHERLMKSPLHKSNILDSDMDTLGVGVARGDGGLFVVEDFCKAR
jgi:uncharacterized protein YkwD